MNRKYKSLFENFDIIYDEKEIYKNNFNDYSDDMNIQDIKRKISNYMINQIFSNFFEKISEEDMNWKFYETLLQIYNDKIIKNIYVFTTYSNEISEKIQNRLMKDFSNIKVLCCDEDNIGKTFKEYRIDENSTFVINNIGYLKSLKENGLLNYSSILIPDKLGYNLDENGENLKIDIQSDVGESVFKLDFFRNFG